jgi:NCS2 family nucleobase:cation symporter-2
VRPAADGLALRDFLSRAADRPPRRPAGLVSWLDDRPPLAMSVGLALQHLAVQSVYFVLPAAVAGAISQDPGEVTRFLCLSILAAAIWQALQVLTRGPVGSGYPVPGTHTAATLGAYIITGHGGGGFGAIAAMVLISGLVATALTFVMQRLRVLLPNEVAGVVVLLIGVALVALGTQQFGLQPGGTPPEPGAVGVMLASLAVMAGLALSRTRAAPFAVLIGALVGVALALAAGLGPPEAAAMLAARPWFALPEPWLPAFGEVRAAPLLAFLLALVAIQATAAGSLVVIQRAADAGWTKPDAPPLRRGLLANGIAITLAGAIGGAAPGPNTAALGLSVATGTLARRIVWAGVPMLVLLALCPKLVALFVLTPAPVKAAMLFYVSGFIMAQGCQLATVRLLDTRRAMVVAFGLSAGIAVAVAPLAFLTTLPALASPLAFGAVVAFLANLATLPLVTRSAERRVALDAMAGRATSEWFGTLAAGWGLKPETARQAERALIELVELLMARGTAQATLLARRLEDRVELEIAWAGEALPDRAAMGTVDDLLGSVEAQERFAVWVATRGAQRFTQRETAQGRVAQLVFED